MFSQYKVYLIVTGLLILANLLLNSMLFVIEGLLSKLKIVSNEIYLASCFVNYQAFSAKNLMKELFVVLPHWGVDFVCPYTYG